jgi:uncharacterized protein
MQHFPSGESHFLIEGPQGKLEVLTLAAKDAQGVGIICHPHPLHQGTMHNKVVYTLSKALHQKGLHTVRFNFRGVGKSEGTFDNSVGEVSDLMAVIDWVDTVLMQPKIWLAGFSFGAYIAAMGATRHTCQQLLSIAPSVENQPYDALTSISCPWVIVQGEADEVVSPTAVYTWFERYKQHHPAMSLIRMPQTSHFFHGNLIILREIIENALQFNLS